MTYTASQELTDRQLTADEVNAYADYLSTLCSREQARYSRPTEFDDFTEGDRFDDRRND